MRRNLRFARGRLVAPRKPLSAPPLARLLPGSVLPVPMAPRIPIGVDDFRKLREGGLEYVDKSDLIRAAGATPIHALAVAFGAKEVRVRAPL